MASGRQRLGVCALNSREMPQQLSEEEEEAAATEELQPRQLYSESTVHKMHQ